MTNLYAWNFAQFFTTNLWFSRKFRVISPSIWIPISYSHFDAITVGVTIFVLQFCSNFNEKSSILACFLMQSPSACRRIDKQADKSSACFLPSILACFLMQLPAACWFFRGSIAARVSTKIRWFWCAFPYNYLRRVNLFVARTRELLFGPACQRGLRTRRYGR